MTYKTVSWTPKGEVSDLLFNHCCETINDWTYVATNPQNVIRTALLDAGITVKKQLNAGDKSDWEQGKSIKTAFYEENANALNAYATEHGVKKQEVIAAVVYEYLTNKPN
jgi:hypothetical protein